MNAYLSYFTRFYGDVGGHVIAFGVLPVAVGAVAGLVMRMIDEKRKR